MYEKQVHKDGIRLAVVTNKGSSLTRYFDKHDLRQLFKLNPPGQCDFLNRLGHAHSGTGGNQFFHRGVIGISSHDILYSEDVSSVADKVEGPPEPQENPFSSPTKPHFTIHESSEKEQSKNVKTMGKSQRILTRDSAATKPSPIALKSLCDKTNTKGFGERNGIQDAKDNRNDITQVFKTVDILFSQGRRIDAMEILMDALENHYDGIDKQNKVQLHGRISSIAHEMQWL